MLRAVWQASSVVARRVSPAVQGTSLATTGVRTFSSSWSHIPKAPADAIFGLTAAYNLVSFRAPCTQSATKPLQLCGLDGRFSIWPPTHFCHVAGAPAGQKSAQDRILSTCPIRCGVAKHFKTALFMHFAYSENKKKLR